MAILPSASSTEKSRNTVIIVTVIIVIFLFLILNYQSEASLMAQLVKNLPAMQETWVRSLGWEDPLEESIATHSSILAGRIPWTI